MRFDRCHDRWLCRAAFPAENKPTPREKPQKMQEVFMSAAPGISRTYESGIKKPYFAPIVG